MHLMFGQIWENLPKTYLSFKESGRLYLRRDTKDYSEIDSLSS